MPTFRKRPVVIDAVRVTERTTVETLEGTLIAEPGMWLITGVKGEQYPCADDVFRATYEAIDAEGEAALAAAEEENDDE